ncbi:MAG: hypothetical protein HQL54_06535 [Magnetococcales bacterium]|nr:hypothetical protein [Magnetococcales bacterium]
MKQRISSKWATVGTMMVALFGWFALAGGLQANTDGEGFETISDQFDIFNKGYIQVVGYSEAGQSRFRAVRAATVVAQRDILEIFKGVAVDGETTVNDGMLESDVIRTRVSGFLRGAQKCGVRYDARERYAEVCLRLYMHGEKGAYKAILPTLQEQGMVQQGMSGGIQNVNSAPAVSSEPEFDGLVIEMAGKNFKPAIVNRILADNGNVIFDPSKIVNAILIERGCGGFTNKVDKAKGLLASWGVKKPLIVKAHDTNKGTDVIVTSSHAASITASDQVSSYLSQAKVVFVVN